MARILILLAHKENRRLLAEYLAETYEVSAPAFDAQSVPAVLREEAFDLAIVDGMTLDCCWHEMRDRRQAEDPVFLPYLLLTARPDVDTATRHLWRTVDDVLTTPLEKVELCARVEMLLRARRYSLESERRYFTLVENSPVGIAIVQDGAVAYQNDVTLKIRERLSDVPSKEILKRVESVRNAAVPARSDGSSGEMLAGGPIPVQFVTPAGPVWVEVRTAPIVYRSRPALLYVSSDITERMQAEQAIVAAKERAEEMARLKTAFLSNMSHEIRTPLTAIIGFADILAEEFAGQGAELTRMIHKGGTRLMETLTTILELAEIEGDSLRVNPVPLDVGARVRESVERFQGYAGRKGLSLQLHAPATPAYAVADPAALDRVMDHLIANAVKFTEEGSLTVTVERDEPLVVVRVEDTGIGIRREFVPYVFDEFKQESEGLTRKYEGNGLGLTISKKLVELMGGDISVASEQGRGSTFTVRLKAAPTQPA